MLAIYIQYDILYITGSNKMIEITAKNELEAFEKLILTEKINKLNKKLESPMRYSQVKKIIETIKLLTLELES